MNAHLVGTTLIRRCFSRSLALAMVPAAFTAAAGSHPPAPTCKALVQVANDLYLVSSSGTQLLRFTSNGSAKQLAALAPDASKVAYVADSSAQAITVVDSHGRQGTFPVDATDSAQKSQQASTKGPLIGLAWSNKNVLQLDHHIGPNNEQFAYYRVPDDLSVPPPLASFASRLQFKLADLGHDSTDPSVGVACTLSPLFDSTACIQGSDVLLNGSNVYSFLGFNLAQPSQTLSVAVGAITSTAGDPSFQLQVSSIQGGVTLRVTLPSGNWVESIVPSGQALPVLVDDQRYGFIPTVTDAKQGIVRIDIVASQGTQSLDPAIAWRNWDNTLAVSEVGSSGRNLTLLAHDGGSATGQWKAIGSAGLPVADRLTQMRFISPSNLFFQTRLMAGLLPVTVKPTSPLGKVTIQIGALTELPLTLAVNVTNPAASTPVLAWSCEAQ